MRPSEFRTILAGAIRRNLPVLVVGAPGIGKTELVVEAAREAKYDILISHPVTADPTDAKGLPFPAADGLSANFLPFGDLLQAQNAKKPTIWFLDDLGQALPAVQASFMQLILGRRVNGHALSDKITFVAATNRRTDRAGVSGVLEPVKSRFAMIVELAADLDEWCQWAVKNNIPSEIVAFLRFRAASDKGNLLHSFVPTADIVNQPSPRTWKHAGDVLSLKYPAGLEFEALKGAIGEGAASEFAGFLRMYRELPDLNEVIADPDNATIPKNPAAMFAVATGIAGLATKKNLAQVVKYAQRLAAGGKGEFAALTVRDFVRRDPELASTQAYANIAFTELGKLIAGDDD